MAIALQELEPPAVQEVALLVITLAVLAHLIQTLEQVLLVKVIVVVTVLVLLEVILVVEEVVQVL